MSDNDAIKQVLNNPGLKTKKEKAAAIYGAIAILALTGEVERAKKLATDYGVNFAS